VTPQRPSVDARRGGTWADTLLAAVPAPRRWAWWTAAGAAAAGILLQITYILVAGEARRLVSIAVVVAFALAAVLHAVAVRGVAWGMAMAVSVSVLALAVEAVGTATGFPFGAYSYTGTLGPEVADVPVLIPLAWLWMAYPCYLAGQALAGRRWGWLVGAWTLATWDLFLDSMMVNDGHWVWDNPTPALPGIPGIPLTNYAGWIATAILMMLAIATVTRLIPPAPGSREALSSAAPSSAAPSPAAPSPAALSPAAASPAAPSPAQPSDPAAGRLPVDAVPAAVLAWAYIGSVMANLVFLSRPATAVWGGLLMGITAIPYLRLLAQDGRALRAQLGDR
jgi:putative membrane protein